jgi:methionyl-tRNA synthetase
VHGFLTVNNGEKMSKSRGTGMDPLKYLALGMNPEWLRYYIAAKLNAATRTWTSTRGLHGARQQPTWWASTSTLPRARPASSASVSAAAGRGVGRRRCLLEHLRDALPAIAELYEEREYGKALRETMLLADRVNAYVDQNKPWELAKQPGMDVRLHDVCTTCIEAFRC